jgi:hypothetical protein
LQRRGPNKLHRCRFEWLKTGPCWRVEKALKEMGVDYELAPGPSRPSKRDEMMKHTGQRLYPAMEFEDGRGTAKSRSRWKQRSAMESCWSAEGGVSMCR